MPRLWGGTRGKPAEAGDEHLEDDRLGQTCPTPQIEIRIGDEHDRLADACSVPRRRIARAPSLRRVLAARPEELRGLAGARRPSAPSRRSIDP